MEYNSDSLLTMFFKFKNRTKKTKGGFTLVELLVVFFIMGTILAVILPDYLNYSTQLELENLALDVALTIREAQVYGGGAKVSLAGDFNTPYGVHFERGNSSFLLFENISDGNGNYNRYTSADNIVSTYTIKNGYSVYALCHDEVMEACDNTSPSFGSIGSLDVVFHRPNPEATIKTGAGATVDGFQGSKATGFIVLVSPDQATTTVQVEGPGSISVLR